MRLFRTKKRIAVVATATVVALAGGGAAFAYFTTSGSGNGNGTVGTATAWGVAQSSSTGGPLLPGVVASNETITFTITNNSTAAQHVKTVVASVPASGGDVLRSDGTVVTGCTASWFTATAGPAPTATIAAGGTADVTVTLSMSDPDVNQDSCQNLGTGPRVTLNVT